MESGEMREHNLSVRQRSAPFPVSASEGDGDGDGDGEGDGDGVLTSEKGTCCVEIFTFIAGAIALSKDKKKINK
jgi:hypothetical protein